MQTSNSRVVSAAQPSAESMAAPVRWWRSWWRSLSPTRQDRFAALAPLASVLMFMAAIIASFWYLRTEEVDREQEALRRDVEYAQQRVRLRLLERQEQLMRMARDLGIKELGKSDFAGRAEALISQYPELQSVTWLDDKRHVLGNQAAPTVATDQLRVPGETMNQADAVNAYQQAREMLQPIYVQSQSRDGEPAPLLQLHVPINSNNRYVGELLGEFSVDSLLRYGAPTEVMARYAVTMRDSHGRILAGTPLTLRKKTPGDLLNIRAITHQAANEYEVPVSPVGNSLMLRAQAYRTSLGVVGSGLFWLVGTLSAMTAWMLLATWRHTRRRQRAQEALVAETNFRRAMENSVLTGMRALDLQGRITYVNAAFCQMTGWSEQELVGQVPPYSYWPDNDYDNLHSQLREELSGKTIVGGFQVRVKRKNGTLFDARLYVSPLIDAHGQHTGWMSSMTDITEPNRIREQLSASYERFTIVLEALDASVSVAPLGGAELLFANKLYRQWFGSLAEGHLQLVAKAGVLPARRQSRRSEGDDAGMSDAITDARSENAEIFVPDLGKWLEVRSRYLSWVDGRLAQMVIATDITQRRLAEDQAAQQAEKAQTASRLITMGEMASSVAHELNQPLTAISNYSSGMLSRLEKGTLTEEQMKFALEKTAHQAQRAGQIIQRIRSFVKKSEPNRTLAQVSQMVNEAVELAGIELRRRSVQLSTHVAERLPPVMADTILIEQVLINLMKNSAESIDHSGRPAGQRSVELRVRPQLFENLKGVEFTVEDTGKGLPPEVLEHLFEAFFSTKSEGMGIGLNLCRSIVESHQGRMRAENLYNGSEVTGCRFSFWLPLATMVETTTLATSTESIPRTIA